jgi:hypothetical protein
MRNKFAPIGITVNGQLQHPAQWGSKADKTPSLTTFREGKKNSFASDLVYQNYLLGGGVVVRNPWVLKNFMEKVRLRWQIFQKVGET